MGEQRAESLGSPRATRDDSSVASVQGPWALSTQLKKVYPRSRVDHAARFTTRTYSFTCDSSTGSLSSLLRSGGPGVDPEYPSVGWLGC
jgi:hypothetical protein